MRFRPLVAVLVVVAAVSVAGCSSSSGGDDADLVVYSGREEELIGDLVDQFEEESGLSVDVRYGDSAELAVQLLEEGDRSPADVFWAQDAGSLGAVADEGLFTALEPEVTGEVAPAYRSAEGLWVGTSGRARVLAYDPRQVADADLPRSVFDLTDPRWRGEVAIAPTNASFQAFVTAMRLSEGEDVTRRWLEDMKANDAQAYESNDLIMGAVDAGDVAMGLVNHYYLYEYGEEVGEENLNARVSFMEPGDPGSLVNVAGVGILAGAAGSEAAAEFAAYLLSDAGQQYIVDAVGEYPLTDSVEPRDELPPLDSLQGPDVALDDLSDLEGTLALLTETGWI